MAACIIYTPCISGDIDTTKEVIHGNINVERILMPVQSVLEKKSKLCELNNQCLAIKEQISLFFR